LPEAIFEHPGTEWLSKGGKWPDEIRRYAIRHIHDHEIYSGTKTNDTAIKSLAHHLKIGLHLTSSPSDYNIVDKCRNFVTFHVRQWDNWGFLEVTTNGATKRTREFEGKWKVQRDAWMANWNNNAAWVSVNVANTGNCQIPSSALRDKFQHCEGHTDVSPPFDVCNFSSRQLSTDI